MSLFNELHASPETTGPRKIWCEDGDFPAFRQLGVRWTAFRVQRRVHSQGLKKPEQLVVDVACCFFPFISANYRP